MTDRSPGVCAAGISRQQDSHATRRSRHARKVAPAQLIVASGNARRRVRVEPGADETTLAVLPEPATATSGRGASEAAGDAVLGGTRPGAADRRVTVRVLSHAEDTCVVSIDGRSMVVRVAPAAGGGHHAMTGGDSFEVVPDPDAPAAGGAADRAATHTATADAPAGDAAAADTAVAYTTAATADAPAAGRAVAAAAGGRSGVAAGAADLDALCAPMPATVTAILVDPGSDVAAGDPLVRLEAMKMELAVRAPMAGRVRTVDCRVGELVQPGRPLVTLDAEDAAAPGRRCGS